MEFLFLTEDSHKDNKEIVREMFKTAGLNFNSYANLTHGEIMLEAQEEIHEATIQCMNEEFKLFLEEQEFLFNEADVAPAAQAAGQAVGGAVTTGVNGAIQAGKGIASAAQQGAQTGGQIGGAIGKAVGQATGGAIAVLIKILKIIVSWIAKIIAAVWKFIKDVYGKAKVWLSEKLRGMFTNAYLAPAGLDSQIPTLELYSDGKTLQVLKVEGLKGVTAQTFDAEETARPLGDAMQAQLTQIEQMNLGQKIPAMKNSLQSIKSAQLEEIVGTKAKEMLDKLNASSQPFENNVNDVTNYFKAVQEGADKVVKELEANNAHPAKSSLAKNYQNFIQQTGKLFYDYTATVGQAKTYVIQVIKPKSVNQVNNQLNQQNNPQPTTGAAQPQQQAQAPAPATGAAA